MTPYDKKTANKVLENVLSSQLFAKSEFDHEILKYLLNKSMQGEIPKETTIAMDLFNKDSSFDPSSDSLVRTHIYSMRKKLEQYYLTEGRNDTLRIVIPKGRYEAIIKENKDEHPVKVVGAELKQKASSIPSIFFIGAAIVFLLTSIYLYTQLSQFKKQIDTTTPIQRDNPIWSAFVTSEYPTLLVFGDYFAFKLSEKKTQGDRRVRDGAINSEADLQAFLERNPEEREHVSDSRSHYLEAQVPEVLKDVLPFLRLYSDQDIEFEVASFLTEEHLENNNIIFFGPFKTLGILERYIKDLKYRFELYPHRILDENDESILERFSLNFTIEEELGENYYSRDFGHIVKLFGKKQNNILIIAAFGPNNVVQMVNKITNPEFISEIRNEYLDEGEKFPNTFECLLRLNRVDNEVYNETMDFINLESRTIIADSLAP